MKNPRRPKDTNQLAKLIVDLATEQTTESIPQSTKNPHAVELGRLGGLKGGKARAEALSPKKRSDIAKLAAKKRWSKSSS